MAATAHVKESLGDKVLNPSRTTVDDEFRGVCSGCVSPTDSVLNTLRLSSAKQRAAKLASTHGLPALREMAKALKETDIKAVAVFLVYGTKDFSDDNALPTKAEVLGVVTAKESALAFAEGDITDQELLGKSTVLISERDAIFDFTKVELKLE